VTAPAAPYTLRAIEEMLGLGRGVVASLIDAGFVSPTRGPRNEYRFSFQDVVLLRTAHDLRSANIPPRRMLRSLRQLKSRLPQELPLSGLRIQAIGNDVAVREGDAHWEAETGQLLLDFEVAASPRGTVALIQRAPAAQADAAKTAVQWFERGEQLEAHDPSGAEQAYRQALKLAPDHEYAYVNLGALLCEGERFAEALQLYDEADRCCPEAPLIHFNRAIALEDLQRDAEALASYLRCLDLDADFADAHYNAARLYEKLGQAQAALRHYGAYRRLQPHPN